MTRAVCLTGARSRGEKRRWCGSGSPPSWPSPRRSHVGGRTGHGSARRTATAFKWTVGGGTLPTSPWTFAHPINLTVPRRGVVSSSPTPAVTPFRFRHRASSTQAGTTAIRVDRKRRCGTRRSEVVRVHPPPCRGAVRLAAQRPTLRTAIGMYRFAAMHLRNLLLVPLAIAVASSAAWSAGAPATLETKAKAAFADINKAKSALNLGKPKTSDTYLAKSQTLLESVLGKSGS